MGLGQLGGPSRHPVLRDSLPPALGPASSPSSNPEYLPASLLQRWEQDLETCKWILEKAGKQKDPQRQAAPSEAWPCLAWRQVPHRPSLQVAFLIKGASCWVSDDYGINHVTLSLLGGTLRRNFQPHTNHPNKGHLRQFPPLNENHTSSESSLGPRLLTP